MSPARKRLTSDILIGVCVVVAAGVGVGVGLGLAATRNADDLDELTTYQPDLPTNVLDRNGNLITQFFSEQKRELISIDEVPEDLINAVLTREDKGFFKHRGWEPLKLVKALFEWAFLGYPMRGASTITQQLAGGMLDIRQDISVSRKLRELWAAWQLERRFTKEEILERYLNKMDMGHGAYGVEAASQFYFHHSARQVTLAESALLVVIYANPGMYSPLKNPQAAKERSRTVLDQMVGLGYATKERADESFDELWANIYQWNRSATSSAFYDRDDKARYFGEYIRGQLEDLLFGAVDFYRDGLTVETTLDLELQHEADDIMSRHIKSVDEKVQARVSASSTAARDQFLAVVDMLALTFDVREFRQGTARRKNDARKVFIESINPALDAVASMLSIDDLKALTQQAYDLRIRQAKESDIQGALIAIESTTGRILAMVGGRKWENTDQFNRATSAYVQPGSSFKPLYYSLAIDSKKATMATMLLDAPIQFTNPDGSFYQPLNFQGKWDGRMLLWNALANSKNIPSIKVLDLVGVEPAIDWTSTLLGITDAEGREEAFKPPHGYTIGLGVCAVSPLQMARAFATFPNGGQAVEPVSIVRILDRDGVVIAEPAKDALGRTERETRLMSPQAAYIMTQILERTVTRGTLNSARSAAGLEGWDWDRPIAGKTGTTQNWVAAWTVGFTPQVTTAIWFGFDQGTRSMGRGITGATVVGPAWAELMEAAHRGLPVTDFKRPSTGLVERSVCSSSGLLPTADCPSTETLIFIEGTAPRTLCDVHPYAERQREIVADRSSASGDLSSDIPPEFLEGFTDTSSEETGGEPGWNPLAD